MLAVDINFVAVLISGAIIFALGGLWYSPVLFARQWISVVGKTEEELKKEAKPANYITAFLQGLISAYVLAIIIDWGQATTIGAGAWVGFMCWFGFAGAPALAHNIFAGRSPKLWVIDSGHTLVSFIVSGIILAFWK
jgi:hypothetical protein